MLDALWDRKYTLFANDIHLYFSNKQLNTAEMLKTYLFIYQLHIK